MKILCLTTIALALGLTAARAKAPSFETWSYTGTDIYPSALLATATVDWHPKEDGDENDGDAGAAAGEEPDHVPILGDLNGWIGARIFDVPEGAKIKVEVSSEGWMKPSRTEVNVEEASDEIIVFPKGVFDFNALGKIRQQKPAVVTVKVSINGKKLPEQTENVSLRSINECPFFVNFEDQPPDDLSWMFAAYVNENHPWIDGILKEALEAELVDSFDGYQSGDPDKVVQQVYAIWQILQRHGIKYSDITATPKSKFVNAQMVRFLDESVKSSQANCVDGSVIFASILTKISIKCGLVLVPGHCFVAFDLDAEGTLDPTTDTCIGLETTMLGADKLKPLAELKLLPAVEKLETEKTENEASAKTFLNAISHAGEVFKEHGKEFLDDNLGLDYQIISIEAARELGIMPLATPGK